MKDVHDERTCDFWDAKPTMRAGSDETSDMEQLEVGLESTEEECWAKRGKAPVTTKWVRVNKGTSSSPIIRASLVARDFKTKRGESPFAAMPPLEAKKLLFRMSAEEQRIWWRERWERRKIMFTAVKKAHLNGRVPDDKFPFVKLPVRHKRWKYGMRPAARAWKEKFASKMVSIGFARGGSNSRVFHRQSTGCRCMVHGDDFTFLRYGDHAEELVDKMSQRYDLKVRAAVGDDTTKRSRF